MADKKISQLTGASTPLAGTEVLPIVQGGSTVKVAVSDLTAGRAMTATKIGLGMTATYALDVTDNSTGVQGRISSSSSNGTSFAMTNTAANGRTWRIGNNYVIGNGEWSLYDDTASKEVLRADSSQNVRAVQGNFIVGTAAKGIDFSANTGAAGMTSELLNWYEEGTWNLGLTTAGGAFTAITIADSNTTYTRIGRQVTVRGFFYTSGSITGGSGQVKITGLPFSAASGAVGPTWTNPDTGNYNSPVAAPSIVTVGGTELSLWKSGATNNPAFVSTDFTSGGNSNFISFSITYFV
jgi:hypothetical protein